MKIRNIFIETMKVIAMLVFIVGSLILASNVTNRASAEANVPRIPIMKSQAPAEATCLYQKTNDAPAGTKSVRRLSVLSYVERIVSHGYGQYTVYFKTDPFSKEIIELDYYWVKPMIIADITEKEWMWIAFDETVHSTMSSEAKVTFHVRSARVIEGAGW